MTKKRLEDLLREEVGKPLDSEAETLPEATSKMEPLSETSAEPLSINTSAIPRPKRTNPTKAELETTVNALQEALQAAHQKESSLQQQVANLQSELQEQKTLQQQVANLQSELQEQKTLVLKLQANLEQADQLKADLEEAKAVILQLSEANSKMTQAAKTTKQENKVTQAADAAKQESRDLRTQKLSLKPLPRHSTQLPPPSKKLSNRDIGWFD